MNYTEKIESLISTINCDLVNFHEERKKASPPTQVSSDFLTNKEQGDWAENTLLNGINTFSEKYIAVKYGRDDDIIAGEDNFKDFYNAYQEELDEIGKRPDILIFERADFKYNTVNISKFERNILDELVPKAKCGIEVRSSAFLINTYENAITEKQEHLINNIFRTKKIILSEYADLLKNKDIELYKIIDGLSLENLHVISFRRPSWKSSPQLSQLTNLLKELKDSITEIRKRNHLSITPKVEDLKVVYNWIKKYNVPHYYVQIFFDEAYGISFEKILTLISNPDLEDKEYFIESDVKNHNKTTIKIQANKEANILNRISLPEHFSEMRELGKGRLLYYVKFKNSLSSLNSEAFNDLFGIEI